MDIENSKQLAVKLAGIAQRLAERSESATRRVEQAGAALDQCAGRLAASADEFARTSLHAIERQAGGVIAHGLGRAVESCRAKLQDTERTALSATHELLQARDALQRERRIWIWSASTALVVGAALSVAAALYAVAASRSELARHEMEGALLRAYNQADVTLCDGRLCANVELDGERHGDLQQYRLVKPRPGPP